MILCLDVTSQVCGFAWSSGDVSGGVALETKRPSYELIPKLQELLRTHKLEVLGIVSGPGSFTGIRTGFALAKGLHEALGVRVLCLNKFDLLAFEYGLSNQEIGHLVIPGRGDRCFYAVWQNGQVSDTPKEVHKDELPAGVGFISPADLDLPGNKVLPISYPKTFLNAVSAGLGREELEPLYIRPADTRKNLSYLEKLLASH